MFQMVEKLFLLPWLLPTDVASPPPFSFALHTCQYLSSVFPFSQSHFISLLPSLPAFLPVGSQTLHPPLLKSTFFLYFLPVTAVKSSPLFLAGASLLGTPCALLCVSLMWVHTGGEWQQKSETCGADWFACRGKKRRTPGGLVSMCFHQRYFFFLHFEDLLGKVYRSVCDPAKLFFSTGFKVALEVNPAWCDKQQKRIQHSCELHDGPPPGIAFLLFMVAFLLCVLVFAKC